MKILSEERKIGVCNLCKDEVSGLAFVRGQNKNYFYACFDCLKIGSSKRLPKKYDIVEIDELKEARVELLGILINIAEEDEIIFDDRRLSVVKEFKDEIEDGIMTSRLENYIRFNGNDIGDVLNLRTYALEAVRKEGSKYGKLVELYKKSRLEKWSDDDKNSLKILLSDKEIQILEVEYLEVWGNYADLKEEVFKEYNRKKYENLKEIENIIIFHDSKGYLTENQLKRLTSFYNEMKRRSKHLL